MPVGRAAVGGSASKRREVDKQVSDVFDGHPSWESDDAIVHASEIREDSRWQILWEYVRDGELRVTLKNF